MNKYEWETSVEFKKELEQLINRHSIDNDLNTADFILADYLNSCLYIYETATEAQKKLSEMQR